MKIITLINNLPSFFFLREKRNIFDKNLLEASSEMIKREPASRKSHLRKLARKGNFAPNFNQSDWQNEVETIGHSAAKGHNLLYCQ